MPIREGSGAEAMAASDPSLFDLVSAVVAGALREGEPTVRRVRADGMLEVVARFSIVNGRIDRVRTRVSFEDSRHL